MQRIISKYGLAAHLAFLAVAPLFLFPFVGTVWLAKTILWLSFYAAIWVVLEPSRRSDEMLHDARLRVARAIVRDPLFWVSLALTALAGIRWANGGIRLAYDAEAMFWHMTEPPSSAFPGSAEGAGLLPFATTVALAVLLQGCRHALGKGARSAFAFTFSLLAGVAALVAAAFAAYGYAPALEATECGLINASYAGVGFGIGFVIGVAALVSGFELKWNRYMILYSVAIGGSATGLYFFAPAFAVLVFTAGAALSLGYALFYASLTLGATDTLKCVVAFIIAMLLPVLCALSMAPAGMNEARLSVFAEEGTLLPAGYAELKALLSSISARVWQVHPWLGSGLGTFALDIRFNAAPADWAVIQPEQAAALNGWWMVLAERGIIGVLSFVVIVGFVLFTFVRRMLGILEFRVPHPLAAAGVAAAAATVVESFYSVSFLRPEALMSAAAFLAVAASALPARKRKAEQADKPKIKAG